jgi:membrane-associated phospholipid phosphatase
MPTPLIADNWRAPVAAAAAVAGALVAVLAALVHSASTSFDDWMFRELYHHIGTNGALALLELSAPALSMGILAFVIVFAALVRQWNFAVLAAAGPALAVGLTKFVLKPLIGRSFNGEVLRPLAGPSVPLGQFSLHGVFPSGHETAVASTAMVLLIVVCRLPLRTGARSVLIALLAVWTLLAAVGLVRNFWHYATDTIGALGVSAAVIGGAALAIDRAARRIVQRRTAQPAMAPAQLTQFTPRS